jgi:non-lysosomal glucosylceramidase
MQNRIRACLIVAVSFLIATSALATDDTPQWGLTFRNSGVVRRGMQFEEKMQDCHYVEVPTAWSTPWGKPSGGARYPYLYVVAVSDGKRQFAAPPVGMRSAVPLGGLGAGTIELRADGSFHDWNIFNNSPGGGGKVQLGDALFGLRVKTDGNKSHAWTLRTQPPRGLPSVAEIEYSGAFPVSRLRFRDPNLPIKVELDAYSTFKIRHSRESAAPAVVFSFTLSNPTSKSIDAAIFFNLPNHIRGDISTGSGLSIRRTGSDPTSGSMAVRFGDGPQCSYAAGDDLATIWNLFETHGMLGSAPLHRIAGKHAAAAAQIVLKPGETKTLNLVLAWYLPNRVHAGHRVGNYYCKIYRSVDDVVDNILSRLPEIRRSILEWHQLCFQSGLPDWLQDALVNSVATMAKTGMWLEDGRWRQWESFSCPGIDPVHIHLYRSLPYVLFFPDLQQSELRGYASIQKPDGFICEDLGGSGGKIDDSDRPGRLMGDCTSAFPLAVYNQYLWVGDRPFVDALWPAVKKAAQWQIHRSQRFGLPERLNNTYDWWGFDNCDVVAYNAVLHLAAMRAAGKLAEVEGDAHFAQVCQESVASGQKKLDELLWTGKYYRSWWMHQGGQPDALMADTLYGQLWASLLGLGWIVDPNKARLHLQAEMGFNASPFGLKVMSRRGKDPIDDLVWEAGSLDWASLNLLLGSRADTSLVEAGRVINVWRDHLHDFWDWRDLTRCDDGQPWCNSHYARQLIFWSIPLALSGQQYSAPAKRLSFHPLPDAPARLPWFTPTASGLLERLAHGTHRLQVLSGRIKLAELQLVGGAAVKDVLLEAGRTVELGAKQN